MMVAYGGCLGEGYSGDYGFDDGGYGSCLGERYGGENGILGGDGGGVRWLRVMKE